MQEIICAIKIDADTDRGTRIGIPNLLKLFLELNIPATFLFSLGPDKTGQAITRIFRSGFLKKISRSNIISTYGIRTLLNGIVLPAPHIGKRNENIISESHLMGFEVGIHCYDHIRWQDGLSKMSQQEVYIEFAKAQKEFQRILGFPAKTAGAAGWQANASSFAAYDDAGLLYGSDCRGAYPFFPRIENKIFKTLQIPTTLPTLDELVGRSKYSLNTLTDFYLSQLTEETPNIFTIHAELEGMKHLSWFKGLLLKLKSRAVKFMKMEEIAAYYLTNISAIPICEVTQCAIDGRSGTVAIQVWQSH